MERLSGDRNHFPLPEKQGHIIDAYGNVKPEDVVSLRRQAILYTAQREATETDLEAAVKGSHTDLGDIKISSIVLQDGSYEVFSGDANEYRIQYYKTSGVAYTNRGPKAAPQLVHP